VLRLPNFAISACTFSCLINANDLGPATPQYKTHIEQENVHTLSTALTS
jgi:hypothetical protein